MELITVESYEDRQILAFPDFRGPFVSVLLAAAQGDLVSGTVLGKNTGTGKYEKYTAATFATLATGVVGNNNAITYTAKSGGTAAHGIKIQHKDPASNSQALNVTIENDTIVVSLATSEAGAITSTAADVIAAVNAALGVKDLVTAANTGASDGSGVMTAMAATALAGATDANVTPSIILAEEMPNQAADVNVRAYLGGPFYTSLLVGMDAAAKAAMGARMIEDITIVPV